MSGYFGTDAQRELQARGVEFAEWVRSTPGACNSGRFMSCDDFERLGWETMDGLLDRDGVFGFRMLPAEKVDALSAQLGERGFRLDLWDVFVADRTAGLAASNCVLAAGLPAGLTASAFPDQPDSERMIAIQRFLADNGIVPFSGIMLCGRLCRSTGVVLSDADGAVVATAYGYLPHNAYSPFSAYALVWSRRLAAQHKGRKLGTYVNALALTRVFSELGATNVYEIVSETNVPSRRMVEACGLTGDPRLKGGVATRADQPRFTR